MGQSSQELHCSLRRSNPIKGAWWRPERTLAGGVNRYGKNTEARQHGDRPYSASALHTVAGASHHPTMDYGLRDYNLEPSKWGDGLAPLGTTESAIAPPNGPPSRTQAPPSVTSPARPGRPWVFCPRTADRAKRWRYRARRQGNKRGWVGLTGLICRVVGCN